MQERMRAWNVRVHRAVGAIELGQVHETNEELARCAALSKFGVNEEEADEGELRTGIYPDDDFDVSPA